jgi:hypothetical protein
MANEKKGKGLFGKIADAITGNESKPEEKNDSVNVPPPDNGAANDAVPDQSQKAELKAENTGPKSYSEMLRERAAERKARFSPEQVEALKANKQVNETVNKNDNNT